MMAQGRIGDLSARRQPAPGLRARVVAVVALASGFLVPLAVLQAAPASAASPLVQDVAGTTQLNAIACPSSISCVAVGKGTISGISEAVVVPIANGAPGTPEGVSGLTTLSAVACASATACFAVGGSDVVPITSGRAGTPVSTPVNLVSVACASSTNCLAVGEGSSPAGVPITNGVVGTAVDYPNNENLDLVTCPSSSQCNGYGIVTTVLCLPHFPCVTFYSLEMLTLGTDGTFVNEGPIGTYEKIFGVDCPSSTTCYATTVPESPGTGEVTTLQDTNPGGGPFTIPDGGYGLALTCPSVTTCVAAGEVVVSGANDEGAIIGISNGDPSAPVLVPGVTGIGAALFGVACATTTTCFAVGTSAVGTANEGVLVSITLPNTSVLVPSDAATLSEPAQFDASAPSSGGIASVAFEVTGGDVVDHVICTGRSTIYGWFGQCTTTTVPTGTYTLQSVATNTEGFSSTSAPITVTVNHPLPTTAVLIPSNGDSVAGADALLDASGSANVTSVTFELTGGTLTDEVIGTATLTAYGWLTKWDTTNVPTVLNGTYTLQSVASYASGESTTSAGVTITVDNPPPASSMLVPSNGAIESGTAAVLDATNGPNETVTGFVITSASDKAEPTVNATPTPYGWVGQWNTQRVPNGTYTVESVVRYANTVSAESAPITVTVNNPLPTTTVLVPSSGTMASGTAEVLDASVSGEVDYVTFELTGGTLTDKVIANATLTAYGWLAQWNTTTVPDGTYTLQSVDTLTYLDGTVVPVSSPGVSITLSN
jgi:hypothetical protein